MSDFGIVEVQLQRRLTVLKSIQCQSVQKFRGYQADPKNVWIMSDHFSNRSVLDEMHWLGRTLKEDETCTVACGMLRDLVKKYFKFAYIKISAIFGIGLLNLESLTKGP